jgi:hypothetical protein
MFGVQGKVRKEFCDLKKKQAVAIGRRVARQSDLPCWNISLVRYRVPIYLP